MKTKQSPLDTLVAVVAKTASVTSMKTLADALVTACDDVEEAFDALQAQLKKREFQYREMEAKRDALLHENVRLHRIIDGLRDQLTANASTVADQITRWAEANYSSSHEAQAVVEGCYDTEELGAFGSLDAFKKHAGIRDDYRADIIAAGGE